MHSVGLHCRCFESDGEYAVGGTTNGRILFWKLHEEVGNEFVYEIPKAHDAIISALAVSANGSTLVSGAIDGSVRIWHLTPSNKASTFELASKSEASRKASAANSLTEASGSSSSASKKRQQQRQSSISAANAYRESSIYRPLYQVYGSFAMEESQYFLEM